MAWVKDSRIARHPITGIVAEVTEIGRTLFFALFLLLFWTITGSLTACRPIPKAFILEGKIFVIVENRIHVGNLFLDDDVAQKSHRPIRDLWLSETRLFQKPGSCKKKPQVGTPVAGDSHEKGETTRGQAYSNNAQQHQLGWWLSD
jgi:hypothetical protein